MEIEADPEFVTGIAEVLAREGWRPVESCLPIALKVAEHILGQAEEKLKAEAAAEASAKEYLECQRSNLRSQD
jgi:hypothetical protein